jgi:hypothetical protein
VNASPETHADVELLSTERFSRPVVLGELSLRSSRCRQFRADSPGSGAGPGVRERIAPQVGVMARVVNDTGQSASRLCCLNWREMRVRCA